MLVRTPSRFGMGDSIDPESGLPYSQVSAIPIPDTTTSSNSFASDLIAAGAAAANAAKAIQVIQGPYQVQGTNLVYNPATGQVINTAGGTLANATLPGVGSLSVSIGNYLPFIIGGLALVLLVGSMRRH